MKRYSTFSAFAHSFYSKDLYQDVGRNWKGIGFGYLLLLVALAWIPSMVQMHFALRRFVSRDASGLINQIPRITIKNGTVATDVQTPYFIKDPGDGKTVAMIDLTGKYESLEGNDAKVLLTQHKLLSKQSNNETRVYDLSNVKDFWLDRDRVGGWARTFGDFFAVILYPFCVFGSYVYRILQALFYGLIGLMFASMAGARLNYGASVRLAAVAITPILILDEILSLTPFHVSFWWLICFLVAMGTIFFAVHSNKQLPATAPPQAQPIE